MKSSCISHVADPARGAPSGSSFDRRSDHVGGDIFQGQGRETTFCPNDPGNQGIREVCRLADVQRFPRFPAVGVKRWTRLDVRHLNASLRHHSEQDF